MSATVERVDVLVVDDHPDIRDAMTRLIAHRGYKVAAVNGGRPALDFLMRHRVRVVILDFMMPDLDGLEVLRRIRQTPQDEPIAVLMSTAIVDNTLREHAFSNGANEFIPKGAFDVDQLVEVIRRYLPDPSSSPLKDSSRE